MGKTGEIIPAKRNDIKLVSEYRVRIEKSWFKTVEGIIETAKTLTDAQIKLSPIEFETLKNGLPFGDSVRSMMLSIGNTNRFELKRTTPLLPPNYNILYEFSTLDNEEWKQAQEDGIVNPNITTSEVRKWKQSLRLGLPKTKTSGTSTKKKPSTSQIKYHAFIPPITGLDDKKKKKVETILKTLRKQLESLNIDLIFNDDPQPNRREILQDKKNILINDLEERLENGLKKFNRKVSPEELDRITSAYYQYRYYQDKGSYPYPKNVKYNQYTLDDIRHSGNKFGEDKMGFKKFMKYVRDNKIITQWTPIREWGELGDAKCIKLALEHTKSDSNVARGNYKRQLKQIANRKSTNSKYAQKYLDMLIEG
tara:strand:+ start:1697 stop:2794 length:1098 start_codon:yes stop_codon:yes gene_type:complete